MNRLLRSPLVLLTIALALPLAFASCDSDGDDDNGEGPPPSAPTFTVRINELNPSEQWAELHNTGDAEVDISDLFLCVRPSYATIASLNVLSGNTTIPAGGFLVVEFGPIRSDAGELGLYEASTTNFGNADAILDYIQYGAAGQGRADVAAEAGIWESGAFALSVPAGQSAAFLGEDPDDPADWGAGDPTPGAENVAVSSGT